MRDIGLNPITTDEKIEILNEYIKSINIEGNIGDIRIAIIQSIINRLLEDKVNLAFYASDSELTEITRLKNEIAETFKNSYEYSIRIAGHCGFSYKKLLSKWKAPIPPTEYSPDEIECAIISILNDKGSSIWPGVGTREISYLIQRQIDSKNKLSKSLDMIKKRATEQNGSITLEQIKDIIGEF